MPYLKWKYQQSAVFKPVFFGLIRKVKVDLDGLTDDAAAKILMDYNFPDKLIQRRGVQFPNVRVLPYQRDPAVVSLLTAIKGRFILSYNDCEFVRELYGRFNIEPVSR
jgi:hypothetical protein